MKTIIFSALLMLCGGLYAQSHIQEVQVPGGFDFVQHSVANYPGEQYVVAGTVVPGPVSGKSDILVLMADNAGNIVWSKYVDYGYDEFVGSVIVDSQDNIVLTGYTGINGARNKELIVVKLDGNGNYLADIGVSDAGLFDYGLYGLDLEQSDVVEESYIIVGTGVDAATQSAKKYAFVLQIDQTLQNLNWGRVYQSSITFHN